MHDDFVLAEPVSCGVVYTSLRHALREGASHLCKSTDAPILQGFNFYKFFTEYSCSFD